MSRRAPWPNLFVVGAAKAGTTSLWRYLGEHPDIFMSRVKEPHFFSGYQPPLYRVVHDEASYLRLFAGARTPLRGEASPSYLWSELAAARIERASPHARILIALRDPVDRLYSLYWNRVRVGIERETFTAAAARGLKAGLRSEGPMYRRSVYTANVGRFLELFGENVGIVVFEELREDVAGELAGLFASLGVDPGAASRIRPEPHNPFALPRGRLAGGLLRSERTRGTARRLVPLPLRPRIERLLLERRTKPPIDSETDRMLTELFRDDVRELEVLLRRRLPWGRWAHGPAETEIRTVDPRTPTVPAWGR